MSASISRAIDLYTAHHLSFRHLRSTLVARRLRTIYLGSLVVDLVASTRAFRRCHWCIRAGSLYRLISSLCAVRPCAHHGGWFAYWRLWHVDGWGGAASGPAVRRGVGPDCGVEGAAERGGGGGGGGGLGQDEPWDRSWRRGLCAVGLASAGVAGWGRVRFPLPGACRLGRRRLVIRATTLVCLGLFFLCVADALLRAG